MEQESYEAFKSTKEDYLTPNQDEVIENILN